MAITDNKIINGSGLSELSSQIKSYVNDKIVDEVYVGDTAPTDPKAKLWVDTSAEPSNNSYTKSEIDIKLTKKQDTLTPGDNITIVNGVISSIASGTAEPDKYIKDASVSGNTLTLTKKDDTTINFTPIGGGSSGGVSGYAFTTSKSFTDEDRAHLKEVFTNNNIHMTIDKFTVIRIFNVGNNRMFVVIKSNGSTDTRIVVYQIICDNNLNVVSDNFTVLLSYYLAGSNIQLTGEIVTSDNWTQYISSMEGEDWQFTSSLSESNLYNAKEMVLYWTDNHTVKRQSYLNFLGDFNFNTGKTLGTGWGNVEIRLDGDDTLAHPSITYNGTAIVASNCVIFFILYKT